jgi:DNA-binding transcriptional LysR family regulator
MTFRLPPLNTLRLFEAAGRLQSFKLAAKELDVTPSAVSHGIQALEDWLGISLFSRNSRGLTLTDAGMDYLPAVEQALTLLSVATDRVPGRPPRQSLSISVAPMFGSRLLLPRLEQFRDLFPDVTVQIDTSNRRVEFPRDGFDLAIRIGIGDWPDLEVTHVLDELLVPVCSAELQKKLGSASRLCDAPLIHVTSASQDWAAWAEQAGYGPIDCQRGLMVDTFQLAVDAAVQGLGVAIGRLPLITPELDAGRLVRFCEPAIPAQTSYWLVGYPESMQRREISDFRDWLLGQMSALGGQSGPAIKNRTGPDRAELG